MAIKSIVSYVSGTGGDFVINCLNHQFDQRFLGSGAVEPTTDLKYKERVLNFREIKNYVDEQPQNFLGSHFTEIWTQLPYNRYFLVVPNREDYFLWVKRDAVTRKIEYMLDKHGDWFEETTKLILSGDKIEAAKLYIKNLEVFNWTLMQMRLVQLENKIDISRMLTSNGIDDLIQQMPFLMPVREKCREYHRAWLANQLLLQDDDWVLNHVANKLTRLLDS